MIELSELLKVLKTSNLEIYTESGKQITSSQDYYEVEPYLDYIVYEIKHNGYCFEIIVSEPFCVSTRKY